MKEGCKLDYYNAECDKCTIKGIDCHDCQPLEPCNTCEHDGCLYGTPLNHPDY